MVKKNTLGRNILLLVACLAVPVLVGFLSSLLSGDIRGSYEAMNQPPLSPPGPVFGIVWPILYLLMGFASWLVLITPMHRKQKQTALTLYAVQLVVNFIWSIVFFRLDAMWVAVVVIVILDILVALTMRAFYRVKKVAMLPLIPYMIWILFATYLSIAFSVVN